MIYVIDTNIFSRTFKNLSFDVFDDIWIPWSTYMKNGHIISVDEVLCELINKWGDKTSKEGQWLVEHKDSFLKPSDEEGAIVAEIFKNKKFREGVKEKSLREGSPEADALLVAKAKIIGGIIVTAESDSKPHSEKIPNIACAFGVPYMKIDDFYKMLKNISSGKSENTGVLFYRQLGVSEELPNEL